MARPRLSIPVLDLKAESQDNTSAHLCGVLACRRISRKRLSGLYPAIAVGHAFLTIRRAESVE